MNRYTTFSLVTCVLTALTGCDRRSEAISLESPTTEAREVDGRLYIHNQGTPPTWSVQLETVIGPSDGEAGEFGRVNSIVADRSGNVYVADGIAREVSIFSRSGSLLDSFGRAGGGPGEFRTLTSLGWIGDSLIAHDPGNGRLQLFAPTGELTETRPTSTTTGPVSVLRLHPAGEEAVFAMDLRQSEHGLQRIHTLHTAAGALDSVPTPEPPEGVRMGMRCEFPDGLASILFPSAPSFLFSFTPTREIVSSWTDSSRVAFQSLTGDTIRIITWDRAAVPIPDADWRQETEPYRDLLRRHPSADCDPSAPERPRHRSAMRQILFDDKNRMWVESAVPDGFIWDIFDEDGRWIAEARAPSRDESVPPYVRGGYYHQVEADELGVQSVAIYRIVEQ